MKTSYLSGYGGSDSRALLAGNRASAEAARHLPFIKMHCNVRRVGQFINFYYAGRLMAVVDGAGAVPAASYWPGLPASSFEAAARAWAAWDAARAEKGRVAA